MALLVKELRALRWPALVLAVYGLVLAQMTCRELHRDLVPSLTQWDLRGRLPLTMAALAIGAWCVWSEERGGTWSLLMTRPASRGRLLATKLGAALLVVMTLGALTLAIAHGYLLVPGRVCGPVGPELLDKAWHDLALLPVGTLFGALVALPRRTRPAARWLMLLGGLATLAPLRSLDGPVLLAPTLIAASVLALALWAERRGDWA